MAITTMKQLVSTLLLLSLSSKLCAITFTTDDCERTKGCFRSPQSCTTSDNCDFLVTYSATNSTHVEFELSGQGAWIAVGFSDDQNMADTDILMCVNNRALSGHYYATAQSTPPRTDPTPAAVEFIEQEADGDVMTCRISRLRNPDPAVQNFENLNQEVFLLAAYGSVEGGEIRIHSTRQASTSKVNVTALVAVGGEETGASRDDWMIHGILMTLAWTLFAFVGLFTARYMRQVWEPRKLLGEKAWFTVHRTLMTITLLLTIASTIFIFFKVNGWSDDKGVHPFCGMVAITFAVIQPIMAAFRPHPGEPRRNIFNWAHRIVGFIALIMAVVTIYLGLCLYNEDVGKRGLYAVIAFYVGELCVLLFELYLILSKRNKEKRTSQVTNEIPMSQPGHQAPTQPEMTMKEAMIRTLMFLFVILVGASVSLTIILLLALN